MKSGYSRLVIGALLALGMSMTAAAQGTITFGASVQLTGSLANTGRSMTTSPTPT